MSTFAHTHVHKYTYAYMACISILTHIHSLTQTHVHMYAHTYMGWVEWDTKYHKPHIKTNEVKLTPNSNVNWK